MCKVARMNRMIYDRMHALGRCCGISESYVEQPHHLQGIETESYPWCLLSLECFREMGHPDKVRGPNILLGGAGTVLAGCRQEAIACMWCICGEGVQLALRFPRHDSGLPLAS